ncbi:MAG TPA: aldolase [Pseudonocardiaceae bacterium]|jgi:citrate lyase beta subunit|nr:aldolase [Pseudonocardiaceae bacterium]
MAVDLTRLTAELDTRLARADAELAARYPGDRGGRQPVHTVYVPADRYAPDLCPVWGAQAEKTIDEHEAVFAELVEADIAARVREKLRAEPIEDLRIDFEDGYGPHPGDVEDAAARTAAFALASSQNNGTAPPFHGIRIKSFEAPTRARGVRTLGLFLDALLDAGGRPGVITLPKVTSVDQVEAMVFACDSLEQDLGLDRLGFEIQVETPQSILGPDGTALVARMIHAADGRCTGLHYGTYDYSAFCGIAAEYQSMAHAVADHAKLVMQAAAAGTGVRLSDGSTNVLPVGDNVKTGWQLHLGLVTRSLERGFYQGWDLHPAQLPTRFAATFAFYRKGLDRAATRLRDYVGGGDSAILDEPATARALADFLLRAVQCGAATEDELAQLTGLDRGALTGLARPGR